MGYLKFMAVFCRIQISDNVTCTEKNIIFKILYSNMNNCNQTRIFMVTEIFINMNKNVSIELTSIHSFKLYSFNINNNN